MTTRRDAPRTALITGASSGIGEAFATVFAAGAFDLIITARRADRLQAVAERIEREHGRRVHVIVCDLGGIGAATRLSDEIAARGLIVDALVNNAGYAIAGDYVDSPWDRQAALLQPAPGSPTRRMRGPKSGDPVMFTLLPPFW